MSSPYVPRPEPFPFADPTPPGPHGPPGPRRLPPLLVGAVVVLVVLLAAAGTVAVVQSDRLADARDDARQLEEQLADSRSRVEELEDAEGSGRTAPGASTPADPLEDVFGGDLDELLEQFEDLLGPDGPLGDPGAQGPGGGLGGPLGDAQADTSGCLIGLTDVEDISGSSVPEQIARAVSVVEEIRGQRFPDPVEPAILDSAAVQDRIDAEVAEVYPAEAAAVDLALLSALGAVPDDLDLAVTQTELLGEQVAGFYDPDTQELVVRSDDPDQPLDVLGVITLVHELEHALADATVGLPDLEDQPGDEDGTLAEVAVVEGDAVALQTFATSVAVAPADLLALLADPDALAAATAGLEGVPHYLASALTFPYVEGSGFVCDAYATGGWAAVDALLADPPTTTAEILFGEPVDPAEPEPVTIPEGYELVEERTFGAAQLSWLFAAPGGDPAAALPDAREAARGWAGGRISLLSDAAGTDAVALALVDGGGLCDAVTTWWGLTAPSVAGRTGTVVCMGDQVRVGIAASEAVALEVIGA